MTRPNRPNRSARARRATRSWALGLTAGALLSAPVAVATTIEVTHLVDDANPANGTCTLREAIRAANGNVAVDACPAGSNTVRDEILVIPGVHQVSLTAGAEEDLGVTGDLDLRGPVRLRGAGAKYSIVEGSAVGAIDRLLHIQDLAEDVVIQGVTLRGGRATTGTKRGGVVWNQETGANDVELVEIAIEAGFAASGGGLFNEGNLKIQDGRIVGGRTEQAPGTTGNHGGGIASAGVSAELRIEDSEIVANQAEEDGGGIWSSGASLVLYRSRVSTNVTGGAGGGLYVASAGFDVQYVEFADNRAATGGGVQIAEQGEVQRSAIVSNQATVRGGGVYDGFGGFVRYSTIAQNVAPQGAAIYADSNQTLLDADTIAENQGGGVFNQRGVFFENVILSRNVGGNCTGNPPNFGAFNMERGVSCGFTSSPSSPNFPNTDPLLGPLADNGGPTRTMALQPGSPAIDVVTSEIRTNCQNMLDQRGHPRGRPRTQNGLGDDVYRCDAGAVERTSPFVVTTLADAVDADLFDDVCATAGGSCSLRAAVQQANAIPGMNEIVLGSGTHTLTIPGTSDLFGTTGDLDVVPPALIRGLGVGLTTVNGGGLDRVFEFGRPPPEISAAPMKSFVRDLTITGGNAGNANGGGIAARSALRAERIRVTANDAQRGSAMSSNTFGFSFGGDGHRVELVDSTIDANPGGGAMFLGNAVIERSALVDNLADDGHGGAGEYLRLQLLNSTVSGNFSPATGALFANSAVIDGSTIYDNETSAQFDTGGVFLLELSVLRNSILADNFAAGLLRNCSANPDGIFSLGHNLTDGDGTDCLLEQATDQLLTDPLLGLLASNGGPTRSHLPLAGSPAIDAGGAAGCFFSDQRGHPRPLDGDENGSAICDVGAVEVPEPALCLQLAAGLIGLAVARRRGSRLRGRFGRGSNR